MPLAPDLLRSALPATLLGLDRASTNVPDEQDEAFASAMALYGGGEASDGRAMLVATDAPGHTGDLLDRIAPDGFAATADYAYPDAAFYAMADARGAGLVAVLADRLVVLLTAEHAHATRPLADALAPALLDRFATLLADASA